MQYKVPQNVDIEDKVIAGLTLRQFTFLMSAGGAVLALKFLLPPSLGFLFMPLAIIVGIFGLALAFYKINDRPFEIFLVSAIKSFLKPSKRIWKREIEINKKPEENQVKKQVYVPKKNLKEIRSNLERLAMAVDSGASTPENRISNITSKDTDGSNKLNDVLEKTEIPSEKLDNYISEAKAEVGKSAKEAPISTLASVNPVNNNFEYENLQLKNEGEMAQMLEAANEKQKEVAEKLSEAKIEKFDR